jgi:hypothetical protein
MSRKKIDLHLNIKEILGRIEAVKDEIYPEKKTGNKNWAILVGVSESLVSQLHPRKPRNEIKEPSLEYITVVALATRRPYEWYLRGDKAALNIHEQRIPWRKDLCPFCGDMPDDIKALCKRVKDIMESGHRSAVPALLSNITAFEDSVEQDEDLRKLKEKVRHHEKLLSSDTLAGTGRAAGAGMRKRKT